jgi:hypothetical protein
MKRSSSCILFILIGFVLLTPGVSSYDDSSYHIKKSTDTAIKTTENIQSSLLKNTQTKTISINPVGTKKVGSKFEITGTTKLESDNDDLLIEVTSSSFNPANHNFAQGHKNRAVWWFDGSGLDWEAINTFIKEGNCGAMGIIYKFQKRNDGLNKWFYVIDTSTFKPDEYVVKASSVNTDVTALTRFNMV